MWTNRLQFNLNFIPKCFYTNLEQRTIFSGEHSKVRRSCDLIILYREYSMIKCLLFLSSGLKLSSEWVIKQKFETLHPFHQWHYPSAHVAIEV